MGFRLHFGLGRAAKADAVGDRRQPAIRIEPTMLARSRCSWGTLLLACGHVALLTGGALAPEVRFTDVTQPSGIDFIHGNSATSNKHLVEKVEGLALITRALFELLEESTGVSEEQLRAKITEIDLRDGQADGRMSPRPTKCPKCDAMMSPRFGRCLFCGEQDKSAPVF